MFVYLSVVDLKKSELLNSSRLGLATHFQPLGNLWDLSGVVPPRRLLRSSAPAFAAQLRFISVFSRTSGGVGFNAALVGRSYMFTHGVSDGRPSTKSQPSRPALYTLIRFTYTVKSAGSGWRQNRAIRGYRTGSPAGAFRSCF